MRELLMAIGVGLGAGVLTLVLLAAPVRADEECGKCPSCPSAKTIAEQVVENINADPQPTIVRCGKGRGSRAGSGFTARCLVLFPAAGTPPLVAE